MKLFRRHYIDVNALPPAVERSRLVDLLRWTAIITAVLLIQINAAPFGLRLNLTVLIPFYLGLRRSPQKGMLAGMIVGLVEDTLSNTIIGPNMLAMGMVGLLSPYISGRLFIWTPFFGVIACFVISAADSITVYVCRKIFFVQPTAVSRMMIVVFVQALVNAPLGFFIRPRDE